jgi:hypothetical protein
VILLRDSESIESPHAHVRLGVNFQVGQFVTPRRLGDLLAVDRLERMKLSVSRHCVYVYGFFNLTMNILNTTFDRLQVLWIRFDGYLENGTTKIHVFYSDSGVSQT